MRIEKEEFRSQKPAAEMKAGKQLRTKLIKHLY
jgi:hypothetical protein